MDFNEVIRELPKYGSCIIATGTFLTTGSPEPTSTVRCITTLGQKIWEHFNGTEVSKSKKNFLVCTEDDDGKLICEFVDPETRLYDDVREYIWKRRDRWLDL